MRSAFALRIISGRIILNFGVQNELPQSKPVGFDSSLWEGAFGMAGKLLIALETLAPRATACALSVIATRCHLSQRERQEHCRKLSRYT